MKKQRFLCLLLCVMLVFVGCGKKADNDKTATDINNQTAEPTESQTEDQKESQTEEIEKEKVAVNIGALKGPTAIGMIEIMENAKNGKAANDYNFTIAGAADEISAALIKGELDMAAVPCNLAAVLYQKTEGKIMMAGINTLGVLYIVETGDSIKTVSDLKGKTIYSTGFGTTPQYTLNYLLKANGIDPEKDVTIEYKTEATEVAAALSESENAIAMLPQPYVTTVLMNNDKLRIALNITEEWERLSEDSSVVTGVLVVRKEFAENHKEVVDQFFDEYTESVNFVNSQVEDAAALVESFDIFKAAVAKQAIPYCNIVWITGDEMQQKAGGYLNVLYEQNPNSVGGALPESDFYYQR